MIKDLFNSKQLSNNGVENQPPTWRSNYVNIELSQTNIRNTASIEK